MKISRSLQKLVKGAAAVAMLGGVFAVGTMVGAANLEKPKSVIHVVTFMWADGTTPAKKAEVMAATEKMAKATPGLTRLWTKGIKVQGPKPEYANNAIVMEFESQEAFGKYAGSPAHKEWYSVWIPARGESRTHDITNSTNPAIRRAHVAGSLAKARYRWKLAAGPSPDGPATNHAEARPA
ncbi:MAG: Dabb family protein [Bryobacterales bacterium]|nr:Dabb family protein [Bryobacterales bacterium]